MKKIISIVLCMVLTLTFGASALATNEVAPPTTAYYSMPTGFSSIKKAASGEYAMLTNSPGEALPVGRLDIEVGDATAVNEVLGMDNVSAEVKEYISQLSVKANNDPENSDLIATLFSQDLLPKTRGNSTYYTTYNGMAMKRDQVFVYNVSTGYSFKIQGTRALDVAKIVYDVGLFIGGLKYATISLGGTLLSIFQTAAGANVIEVTAQDYTQMKLIFDDVKQWVYGKYNGVDWYLGYCSQKIVVKNITIEQQFIVNSVGTIKTTFLPVNQTIRPPDHDNPWPKAYTYILNPVTEWVTYKIYGMTYYFL